jgi:hypothetical protein
MRVEKAKSEVELEWVGKAELEGKLEEERADSGVEVGVEGAKSEVGLKGELEGDSGAEGWGFPSLFSNLLILTDLLFITTFSPPLHYFRRWEGYHSG